MDTLTDIFKEKGISKEILEYSENIFKVKFKSFEEINSSEKLENIIKKWFEKSFDKINENEKKLLDTIRKFTNEYHFDENMLRECGKSEEEIDRMSNYSCDITRVDIYNSHAANISLELDIDTLFFVEDLEINLEEKYIEFLIQKYDTDLIINHADPIFGKNSYCEHFEHFDTRKYKDEIGISYINVSHLLINSILEDRLFDISIKDEFEKI